MKRFLLKDGVSREAAEEVFDAVGWHRVDGENAMPEIIGYKSSWLDADETEVANYLENIVLGCSYVLATDASFGSLEQAFEQAGLLLDRDEVLATEFEDDASALRTVGRLGLLAHGDFDSKVFSKLTALLIYPNPKWQRYALFSLSNTSWSEFGTVIDESVKEGAFEGSLAAGAQAMLDDLIASNWNEDLYAE